MYPEYVFIVPYRDRKEHKNFFHIYSKYLFEDYDISKYLILFVHQADTRPFNRGAMKNIGFMYLKNKYPSHYENIIFVFNDIDTLPYKKGLLNYHTKHGEIKHFYGYDFALGGIFSVTGKDFEKMNGFPNYWEWGFEDNVLNKRAIRANIVINRDQFYTIGSHKILHFFDGLRKVIDGRNLENQFDKTYIEADGINNIQNLKYEFADDENMLHVNEFSAKYHHESNKYFNYSITNGPKIQKKVPQKRQMLFL